MDIYLNRNLDVLGGRGSGKNKLYIKIHAAHRLAL